MKRKILRKHLTIALLIPVFLLQTAAAPHPVSGSLTLSNLHSCESFFIFQVAVYQDSGYIPSAGFESFSFSSLPSSFGDLQSLTLSLKETAVSCCVPPFLQAVSDSSGMLSFSCLPVGLYLILGESDKTREFSYTPDPVLIALPPKADVTVAVKYDRKPSQDTSTAYTVKTIWEDRGYSQNRPSSVTVDLLRNDVHFDTVVLTNKNEWTYTWTDLDPSCRWQVKENTPPTGYTPSVSLLERRFLIVNRWTDNPNTGDYSFHPYVLFISSFFLLILLLRHKKKQRI